MNVRPAGEHEVVDALRLLEGALLDVDAAAVSAAAADDRLLLAVDGDRAIGALLAEEAGSGTRIDAIAVRRTRRRSGVGTALLDDAADRWDRLVATCRPELRPFYERAGFDVEQRGDRLVGVR